MNQNFDGHMHSNPWKDYDVLNCIHCSKVILVPRTDMSHECPHCGCVNVFEIEESDEQSADR